MIIDVSELGCNSFTLVLNTSCEREQIMAEKEKNAEEIKKAKKTN